MSSTELAILNKRPFKKPRNFKKVDFDLTQDDSDGEPYEEVYESDFESDQSTGGSQAEEASPSEDEREAKIAPEEIKPGKIPKSTRFWMVTDFHQDRVFWRNQADKHRLFVTGQEEICPETKRPHLQLYVETNREMTRKAFSKKFGPKLHVEQRKGTQEQAIKYATKEETRAFGVQPFRFGEPRAPVGKSSEQARAIQAVKSGMTLEKVACEFPGAWVRSYKGLTSLAAALVEERKDKVPIKALCLYGPPGGGKTWKAVEIAKV